MYLFIYAGEGSQKRLNLVLEFLSDTGSIIHVYINIYIYMYIYTHVYVYVYIYI